MISPHMFRWVLPIVVVLALVGYKAADGYPYGSGSCIGGQAAVGGSHLDDSNGRNVTSGALSDFGVVLSLNGAALDPADMAYLETNATYSVVLTAPANIMEGCMIRFEALSSKDILLLQPENNVVDLTLCDEFPNALGVTHSDDKYKTECSATLVITEAEPIIIEVTMVVTNSDNGASVYAYNRFDTQASQTVSPGGTDGPTGGTEDPTGDSSGGTGNPSGSNGGMTSAPSDTETKGSDTPSDLESDTPTMAGTSQPMSPSDSTSEPVASSPVAPSASMPNSNGVSPVATPQRAVAPTATPPISGAFTNCYISLLYIGITVGSTLMLLL